LRAKLGTRLPYETNTLKRARILKEHGLINESDYQNIEEVLLRAFKWEQEAWLKSFKHAQEVLPERASLYRNREMYNKTRQVKQSLSSANDKIDGLTLTGQIPSEGELSAARSGVWNIDEGTRSFSKHEVITDKSTYDYRQYDNYKMYLPEGKNARPSRFMVSGHGNTIGAKIVSCPPKTTINFFGEHGKLLDDRGLESRIMISSSRVTHNLSHKEQAQYYRGGRNTKTARKTAIFVGANIVLAGSEALLFINFKNNNLRNNPE